MDTTESTINAGAESHSDNRSSTAVSLRNVTKTFGSTIAVNNTSFDVVGGEFFSMLGPSGSGKTTMLRMIAGFDLPTSGNILLDGHDVSQLAPFERNVNTVFQDYALFPHMTVAKNVEYGLAVKGMKKKQRQTIAGEMLEKVQLEHLSSRKPSQLSGGQKQRVALARALVNNPTVLLLDEPLSALDLKLRHQMQVELKSIQKDVGITFIFVTHDQEEALTMSDRIAIFNNGGVEQIGTPTQVYENPATSFVAGFVGTSNLFSGEQGAKITKSTNTILIRPENISLVSINSSVPADTDRKAQGTITNIQFAGPITRFFISLTGADVKVTVTQSNANAHDESFGVGDNVTLAWASAKHVTITST